MWVLHINMVGEDGPEERYVGPFEEEEDLEDFVENYDLDADFYAKMMSPEAFVKELVTIH